MCRAVYCLFNVAICQSDGKSRRQSIMMGEKTEGWFVTEFKILKYYLLYATGRREETKKHQSIQTMLHSQFAKGTSHLEVTCVTVSVTRQCFVQYIDV